MLGFRSNYLLRLRRNGGCLYGGTNGDDFYYDYRERCNQTIGRSNRLSRERGSGALHIVSANGWNLYGC